MKTLLVKLILDDNNMQVYHFYSKSNFFFYSSEWQFSGKTKYREELERNILRAEKFEGIYLDGKKINIADLDNIISAWQRQSFYHERPSLAPALRTR